MSATTKASNRFHAGRILLAFGRKLLDDGLAGLDLDPNTPMNDDAEDFAHADCASLDVGIVEPFNLPECAELNLNDAVREVADDAFEAVTAGRRAKTVLVKGDGPAPVRAGTRVVHLHDRSYIWRFSIELYVQSKDSAKRAREAQRALKTWNPRRKGRKPEVARVLERT